MNRFRVGLAAMPVHSRRSPTVLMRSGYLSAVLGRADSFWVPDHLNALIPRSIATPAYFGAAKLMPNVDAFLEPWTMLGNLAACNRLGQRRLGIGVTDAGRRNPAVTAQAAATLHLLTRGRAILGLGVGERAGNQPYGVDWNSPTARFEEAVATIRALWNSGGELVSRDSAFYPLRNAVFGLPPYRGRWPEIWIAAHGPRTLRVTGRYGDAWFPAMAVWPRGYAAGLEVVRTAASDANRDPMSVVPANLMFVVTGRRSDDVEEALHSDAMKSFALSAPGTLWARHGAVHPFGDSFTGGHDLIPQTIDRQDALSYAEKVPVSLLKELLLTGTADEVVDQAAEWRDHGMRYLVVCDISALQPSLRKGLAATAPFLRAVRGLTRL